MQKESQAGLRPRAVAKAESRRLDSLQIAQGEDPAEVQSRNSVFREGFFRAGRFSNLARAVGR